MVRPPHCENCPFSWIKTVRSKGNPQAPIVFVGESPGVNELIKNEPFIGPSGQVLHEVFPEDITPNDYYIVNALQCMPPKPSDKVRAQHLLQTACRACRGRLIEEIKAYPRTLVVALGNGALWSLTGDFSYKITQERGKIIESDLSDIGILASVHPAFLLHGGGSYRKFKEDIQYAWKLAAEGGKKKHVIPTWNVAETEEDVIDFLLYLTNQSVQSGDFVWGADIETGGFNHQEDEILAWGLCADPDEVFIFPEETLPWVKNHRKIWEDKGIQFCWHNGKFDVKFLDSIRYNIPVTTDEDTMLMNYALDEVRGQHDLEQVASDVLGAPLYKDMLKPYLPKKATSYRVIPKPVLYEYLAYDVSDTKQIFRKHKANLKEDPISSKLYHDLLIPASKMLVEVEKVGMLVDQEKVEQNRIAQLGIMAEHTAELNRWSRELTGKDINPNSHIQVGDMIYKHLKLAKGKGTGKDILEDLPQHPFVKALRAHRKAAKLYGTYIKPLLYNIDDEPNPKCVLFKDGRVHSTYLIHGTATGRLSSRGPNMQNQPRDSDIRGQFIAGEGRWYLECDLDQAELRCLAVLSGDPELIKIYTTPGMSIHKDVSSFLWGDEWAENYKLDEPGNPIYDKAKEEYMRTKALNFGIVYGREAPSIAEEFEVSIEEAQSWIDGWTEKFPVAWSYIEKCRQAPVRNQNLVTPFGRRKRAAVVSYERLKDLQNEAANFPHQSIASDITTKTAILCYYRLMKMGVFVCNLIHDAILMDLPQDEEIACEAAKLVTSTMQAVPLDYNLSRVPFIGDAKVGNRWGNLSNFKFA